MSVDLLKSEAVTRLEKAVESLAGLDAEIHISVDPIVLEMNRRASPRKTPTDNKAVYWVDGRRVTSDSQVIDENNPIFKEAAVHQNYEFLVDIRGDVKAAEELLKEITFTLTALPEGFQVPGLPESLREQEHFNFRTVLRAIVTTAQEGLLGQSVSLAFRAGGLSLVPALREYLQRVSLQVAEYVEFVPDTLPLSERYVEKSDNECVVDGHLMALRYARALFFARDYVPPPLQHFSGWDSAAPFTRLRILSEYQPPLTVKALQDQQTEPPYFFIDGGTFAEQVNDLDFDSLKRYIRHADNAMKDRTAPKNTVSGTVGSFEAAKGTNRKTSLESNVAKIVEHFTKRAAEGVAMYSDPDPVIDSLLKQYGLEYPTDEESLGEILLTLKTLA